MVVPLDAGTWRTPDEVAEAAMLACLLEVAAPKPGNVTRYHDLPGLTLGDFLASAVALGPSLAAAGTVPVGETIERAIVATRRRVSTNTNLGIVLLLVPLAAAALRPAPRGTTLRERVTLVLDGLSVADAGAAYRAIRLAQPGGLGTVEEQDVADEPEVTLRAAMTQAAGRDAVAREYATAYATTFEIAYPALRGGLERGRGAAGATVGAYLTLLAGQPDTLIVRRHGEEAAAEVQRRAASLLALGIETPEGRNALHTFDRWLRAARPPLNPGTTADLVTAALFVALLDGLPLLAEGSAAAPAILHPEQGGC